MTKFFLINKSGPTCKVLIGWHTMWPNAGLFISSLTQPVQEDLNGPPGRSLQIFLPIDEVLTKPEFKRNTGKHILLKIPIVNVVSFHFKRLWKHITISTSVSKQPNIFLFTKFLELCFWDETHYWNFDSIFELL